MLLLGLVAGWTTALISPWAWWAYEQRQHEQAGDMGAWIP